MKQSSSILVTCAGGYVFPEIIENLRRHKKYKFKIVGCDTSPLSVGFSFCDSYYVVPKGESDDYIDEILRICKEDEVSHVLPLSDEEAFAISRKNDAFLSQGIVPIVSDHEAVKISLDKGGLLSCLEEKGMKTAEFRLPTDYEQLIRGIEELGFPDKRIVLKPRSSRGGRGFRVIRNDFKIVDRIAGRCEQFLISYPEVTSAFKEEKDISHFMLMEYLPGKDYNIDVLFCGGRPESILANERIKPEAGPVVIGKLVENQEIANLVHHIGDLLCYEFCINIEAAEDTNGRLCVYEINPRVGASIAFYTMGGIDLLNSMMSYAIQGKADTPETDLNELTCFRYWKTEAR